MLEIINLRRSYRLSDDGSTDDEDILPEEDEENEDSEEKDVSPEEEETEGESSSADY